MEQSKHQLKLAAFNDKMEDIKRDLGELIQEFKVFLDNKDIMQQGYDKKLHNDYHLMSFAIYLQLLIQRVGAEGAGDEFYLSAEIPGEVVEAIQALFQKTDAQEQDQGEVGDPEEDEGIADMDVEILEGTFDVKIRLNFICQFTKLGLERIRSRSL